MSSSLHPQLQPNSSGGGTKHTLAWAAFVLCLLVAPQVFASSFAVGMLSQIATAIVVCLSYNLLLGQGGMLSFGHAVYTGLGAFAAVHAMNLAGQQGWPVPLPLVPLVAGVTGLVIAAVLGWFSTRKSGTTFAMITLGLGEMMVAIALMFPQWFGGEGGITTDRVYGEPLLGISFGSAVQVYYLIALYCVVCTAAMWAFTRTPLGAMLQAVRDNAERVAFVGYNPRHVRYLAVMVSGFFAGVGGGLAAIQFEIVTVADSMSMVRSGSYLLFTFLGGIAFFYGPILGAVLMVLCTVWLSEITPAWMLYLGLLFMCMVMYAPGGLASLLLAGQAQWQQVRHSQWGLRAALRVCLQLLLVLCALAGAVVLVEMLYHLQWAQVSGDGLVLAGSEWNVRKPLDWSTAVAMLFVGVGGWHVLRSSAGVHAGSAPVTKEQS